jgi:hypothetical protein
MNKLGIRNYELVDTRSSELADFSLRSVES